MPHILQPQGYIAREIADVWWLMFAISAVIFAAVLVILLLAIFRRRTRDTGRGLAMAFVGIGGVLVPAVVILVLMSSTINALVRTNEPFQEPTARVQVVGHDWWWEFRYPDQGFATANEMHIPAGEPVRLEIASADVIHSFWVPALSGKRDAMPDLETSSWIQADHAGAFRGQCAEFCGLQHNKMAFLVVADEPGDYLNWVRQQERTAPEPVGGLAFQGRQVFLGSSCVYCHTVRGTNATGTLGPDLTHLASRRELAAGTLPNTRGNLAGWILDSQNIKPGNLMPPMPMRSEDLQALLAYLDTLE